MESPTSSSSSDHSWWARGRCIGRGSFATVHIATDKSTGRIFAVKSVPLSNSNQLTALENEIRILRRLTNSSPYVVRYLGDDTTTSTAGNYRNLHLEYLPAGDVSGGGETELVVRSYTRCLVTALIELHSRNIVHCDVKGRNVLVGGHKPGECKLADFGAAVDLSSCSENGRKISPRGSPLWMAPEVLRGEYQGPESDVWSLGCTVIEMLTGKPAWTDRGANDTVLEIALSNQTPEIPVSISEQGRDFLNRCLRREPAERWSCNQLLNHPFLSSIGFESLWSSSTPRCVLDEFRSSFDECEEFGSNLSLGLTSHSDSSDSSLAMEELCCGGEGPVWEGDDNGWMTVRITEYSSHSVTETGKNERMEVNGGSKCDSTLVRGCQLKLKQLVASVCWAGDGGLAVGSGPRSVSDGLLCTLSSYVMLLLITSLFGYLLDKAKRLFEFIRLGIGQGTFTNNHNSPHFCKYKKSKTGEDKSVLQKLTPFNNVWQCPSESKHLALSLNI